MIDRWVARWAKPCGMWLCEVLQGSAIALYFIASGIVMGLAALGLVWYVRSFDPILESGDGMTPQYEVVAVDPTYLKLRWLKLHKTSDCFGDVAVVLYGDGRFAPVGTFPLVIGTEPRTVERIFRFPVRLDPGAYRLNLIVTARCSPLFSSMQTVDIPFEIAP